MLRRGQNSTMNENIPAKPSGRSTSANGGMEISQKKLSENSLQRFKNMASGILGKNLNDQKEGAQIRRAALADMKNVVTNEDNKKISKDESESKFSLLSSKLRRSSSASPKRVRTKALEKKQPKCGITLGKGLTELGPLITNAGMNLRSRHVLRSDAFPSSQHLKLKPTSNEIAVQTAPAQPEAIKKLLKPLPFCNGKRSSDDTYNNEVVYCEQYAADNWDYLFYIENKGVVPSNFLHGSRITPRNRMIAIDWITRMQITFKLLPETQLTTVNLFDRCLMARRFTLEKREIQLISLGCAVVAAKYEEIYPPEISEYLSSCDNTKQEIVRAEINVLHLLNFDLKYPRAIQFIRRLTEHYDLSVHTLAKVISEIASYDYNTCCMKPSVIAAISVFIAAALEGVEFPDKLHRLARVSKAEAERLAPIFASAILELIRNEKSYGAIYRRMCTQRRMVFTNENIAYLTSLVTISR
ncbi:Cyclin, N-terminal domain containing protein [Brugia malayi]|uniref:Bm10275 n=1 Tax=Brugia malayi TaxID=6279 RepID=A0A0J9Y7A7_BRUMA|nr:Cyclin, N-terminal domain containing protein [Brugia malayi]CDQ03871.1 Bm10275 [Brugia malayi]VIO99523.1 Cyclin, N-terminal domain containing protein [Brugia malayi]